MSPETCHIYDYVFYKRAPGISRDLTTLDRQVIGRQVELIRVVVFQKVKKISEN